MIGLDRGCVYHYKCNNEGKSNQKEYGVERGTITDECGEEVQVKSHYFVILTTVEYNKGHDHKLAIPLTSKGMSQYSLELEPSDFSDFDRAKCPDLGKSKALFDKVCRINDRDLHSTERVGKVTDSKLKEIVREIKLFIIAGK